MANPLAVLCRPSRMQPRHIPDAKVASAAQRLSSLGYDVTHQATASSIGAQRERTANLNVDGLGVIDVYIPQNLPPSGMVKNIERKADILSSDVFNRC